MSKGRVDTAAIRNKTDIAAIIGQAVDLRPKDGALWGLCPFHEDRNPSFKVDEKRKNWICFGCGEKGDVIQFVQKWKNLSFLDAAEWLGGTREEEAPQRRRSERTETPKEEAPAPDPNAPAPTLVKVYPYTDVLGNLIYEVHRMSDKSFKQRRLKKAKPGQTIDPAKPDSWIGSLKNGQNGPRVVPYLLYRLPEIMIAGHAGKRIYIVEGEKDADTLWERGIPATCNSEGAGKWHDDHADFLRGFRVTIWRDRDEPGRKHADQVLQSLSGKAREVEVVESRQGKDATDHFDAGCELDEVTYILRAPKLVCIDDVEEGEYDFLFFPYIALGTITICSGDPGEGKSYLLEALMTLLSHGRDLSHVIQGGPANPHGPHPAASSIFLTMEDDKSRSVKPRLRKLGADQKKIFILDGELTFNSTGLGELDAWIQEVEAKMIVIDPLMGYIGAHIDIHRQNETRSVLQPLMDLAAKRNVAIIGLMHQNKSGGTKGIYKTIGSIDFTAAARSAIMVGHDPDDRDKKAVVHIKTNIGPYGPSLGYSMEHGEWAWCGISDLDEVRILEASSGSAARGKRSSASEWLREVLKDGPRRVDEILKLGEEMEPKFSKSLIYSAKGDIQASVSAQAGWRKHGRPPAWWALRGFDWHAFWYRSAEEPEQTLQERIAAMPPQENDPFADEE